MPFFKLSAVLRVRKQLTPLAAKQFTQLVAKLEQQAQGRTAEQLCEGLDADLAQVVAEKGEAPKALRELVAFTKAFVLAHASPPEPVSQSYAWKGVEG